MRRWAVLALLLALAAPVAGHAGLVSSDPASGARLDTVPFAVHVSLSEAIEPGGTTMKVTDAAGLQVDDGRLDIQNADSRPVLTLGLKTGLPDGIYTISWRVLSKDTHTVAQSVSFAVGGFTAPTGSNVSGGGINPEAGVARFLAYLGLTLALGAAAFSTWVLPGRADLPKRLLAQVVAAGTAAHLAGTLMLLQVTSAASQLGYADLYHTSVGETLFLRTALAAAAVILALGGVGGKARGGSTMAVLLLCGNLVLTAMASHSFKDGPVTVALDALHLVAATLWAGGLLLFLLLVVRGGAGQDVAALRRVGSRFGTLAFVSVVALAATGTITGLAIIGRDAVLTAGFALSPYGLFLLAKISVWGVMVLLAAVNRYILLAEPGERGLARGLQRLAAPLSGGRLKPLTVGTRPFARVLAVEAILGVIVLVLAGFLTSLSPPAAASSETPTTLTLRADGDVHVAQLRLDPAPRAGQASTLHFAILETESGRAVTNNTCGRDSCVTIQITAPGNATPEKRIAQPDGHGDWVVPNALWTRSGNWTVQLTVSTAAVFADTIAFAVPVA